VSGWAGCASIWLDCEILLPNRDAPPPLPSWCPQSVISISSDSGVVLGVVLDNGLAITRDSLAWVVAAVYGVYLVSGGVAWWNEGAKRSDDCGTGTGMEMQDLR